MSPSFEDEIYNASPAPPSRQQQANEVHSSFSPSPATSISSDKENRSSRSTINKVKGRIAAGASRRLSPSPDRNKRKRTVTIERDGLADRDRSTRRRTVEQPDPESEDDYDPDQPIEERRGLRQDYRHLAKDFTERRSEMLIPGNHGLRDTMLRANQLTSRVKQTADATIDARLLVSTADLSYKKTIALTSGESAQGVDLEVFITKVRAYMRAGPEDESAAPSNTQRRRGVEEDEEDDDMLNWSYLGRHACIPNIARPAVPGFLLGPLSLEKRAKRVVVRKERLRINDLNESRPEVVMAGDISKSENANLTLLCKRILRKAEEVSNASMNAVEEAYQGEDLSKDEVDALMDRYGINASGGLAFFKFVINPWSFGQTVENMFYTSFLIRDGNIGVTLDDRGLPYISKLFRPFLLSTFS
jgi:hypothetical protein